jgi:Mrp family chromosome partitioning ATPase
MPELVIEPRRENEPTTPSPRQTAEARSREAGSKKPLKPHGDCPLAKLNPREPQIQPVVDTIVQRYLPGSSSLLAFCMSDDNRQLIPAVLSTAAALRERTAARILLIDSEHDRRELSSQMDCTDKQGLIEMSRGHNQLLNLVQATHHPDVDFLPCGLGEWPGSEKFNQCIQRSVAGFTGNYGYVLVSVGVAHSVAADVWAQYADGTFLLVNLKSSNRTIARSAVTQLNSFGARLLGCIATHCE